MTTTTYEWSKPIEGLTETESMPNNAKSKPLIGIIMMAKKKGEKQEGRRKTEVSHPTCDIP